MAPKYQAAADGGDGDDRHGAVLLRGVPVGAVSAAAAAGCGAASAGCGVGGGWGGVRNTEPLRAR